MPYELPLQERKTRGRRGHLEALESWRVCLVKERTRWRKGSIRGVPSEAMADEV